MGEANFYYFTCLNFSSPTSEKEETKMSSSALIRNFSRNTRQLTISHSRQLAISPNPFAVQSRLLFACQTRFAPNLSRDALQTRLDCVRSFSRTCVNERKKKKKFAEQKKKAECEEGSSKCPSAKIDIGRRVVYDKRRGMIPGYGGHVPGIHICTQGGNFGNLTRKVLKQTVSSERLRKGAGC